MITGEFQDCALLRAFGHAGRGIFPLPSVFPKQLKPESLQTIGHTEDIRNHFYAISVERELKHPGVVTICNTPRQQWFNKQVVSAA
jgi:LysR family transcriptional regulator, transcriptional activator of nhaA